MQMESILKKAPVVKYRGYVRGVKWKVAWEKDSRGNEVCLPQMVTHRINVFSDAPSWKSPTKRESMFEDVRHRLAKSGYYLSDVAATNNVYKVVADELKEIAAEVTREDMCRRGVYVKLDTLSALLKEANEERENRDYVASCVKNLPDVMPVGDTEFKIDHGVYTESSKYDHSPSNEIVVFCKAPSKEKKDAPKKETKQKTTKSK